ncbi:putative deoxyribonuclease tatdn2 [Phlyctochytrium planicorne]|nr:putative deoxyribonuclease tatdn2 [Phlyctochytrium planicorne]
MVSKNLFPGWDHAHGIQQLVEKNAFKDMDACINIFCDPKNDYEGSGDAMSAGSGAGGVQKQGRKDPLKWRRLVDAFPFMYFTAGVHPHHADYYSPSIEKDILETLKHPRAVALGEIGLDYYRLLVPKERQQEVFIRQIQVAISLGKPIVIHTRDADADTLKIIRTHMPPNHRFHVHCFTSSQQLASALVTEFPNCFIGFTGVLTFNNARNVQALVKVGVVGSQFRHSVVPIERILIETDAPFMVPRNMTVSEANGEAGFQDKSGRGSALTKVSHPGMTPYVGLKVAELTGVPFVDAMKIIRENTRRMYGI